MEGDVGLEGGLGRCARKARRKGSTGVSLKCAAGEDETAWSAARKAGGAASTPNTVCTLSFVLSLVIQAKTNPTRNLYATSIPCVLGSLFSSAICQFSIPPHASGLF